MIIFGVTLLLACKKAVAKQSQVLPRLGHSQCLTRVLPPVLWTRTMSVLKVWSEDECQYLDYEDEDEFFVVKPDFLGLFLTFRGELGDLVLTINFLFKHLKNCGRSKDKHLIFWLCEEEISLLKHFSDRFSIMSLGKYSIKQLGFDTRSLNFLFRHFKTELHSTWTEVETVSR